MPLSQGIAPYGGPVSKVGDIISFDMVDWHDLGQADFDVRVNKYDRGNRFFSVVTQAGHPLQGWRFWRVTEANGDVIVDTGAVDKANGVAGWLKYNLGGGKYAIMPLWHELLDNVTQFSGGSRAVGDPSDFPEGRWVPDKKDEFLSLVQ